MRRRDAGGAGLALVTLSSIAAAPVEQCKAVDSDQAPGGRGAPKRCRSHNASLAGNDFTGVASELIRTTGSEWEGAKKCSKSLRLRKVKTCERATLSPAIDATNSPTRRKGAAKCWCWSVRHRTPRLRCTCQLSPVRSKSTNRLRLISMVVLIAIRSQKWCIGMALRMYDCENVGASAESSL